jgi:hypothetical protein
VEPDSRTFRGADLLAGTRYDDAPAFFDLALSGEILQIAADYMGEIPLLMKPRLWLTKPQGSGPSSAERRCFIEAGQMRPTFGVRPSFSS